MTVATEKIRFKNKTTLVVTKAALDDEVTVSLRLEGRAECVLHWGLQPAGQNDWLRPPKTVWPRGTRPFDKKAVQTPFLQQNGAGAIDIRIGDRVGMTSIPFVLYFPKENRWDNNKGKNYRINIAIPEKDVPLPTLQQHEKVPGTVSHEQIFPLGDGAQLLVTASSDEEVHHVFLVTNLPGPLLLHWGTAPHSRQEWTLPPKAIRPEGTKAVDKKAVQTPFEDGEAHRTIHLVIPKKDAPLGLPFVLKAPDTERWFNDNGRNFYVPITVPPEYESFLGDLVLADLADAIIERETGNHSWTLMHRFNLCHDLTERVTNNREGWALLFVWFRFSAIRQLDWQRDFNTKPRELAHALDRLTQKLAHCYTEQTKGREFIRLMLTTLGRGGEGQRVRDEILHIMHRHHIKEIAGHFMEEWHQKLHNNTTPDDVIICEAYLDFYHHNGDLSHFYQTLERGGVSKERLRSYDRPIRSDPDFIPHLKDALLHDFGQFLQILKGVHSGTDLYAATQATAHMLDGGLNGIIGQIQSHGGEGMPLAPLVENITEARKRLNDRIEQKDGAVRDLLFLDLALEDHLRVVVERDLHHIQTEENMAPLMGPVMENLLFSRPDEELRLCLDHWQALSVKQRRGKEWALEAKSVFDRTARGLGRIIDRYDVTLQPKAELLGKAFNATDWSITLFTEEVARGRPVFLLSAILRKLDPLLRQKAHLGHWQIVSAGKAAGVVRQVSNLGVVQNTEFQEPTIILTPEVGGNEELPKNVAAVITSDTVDIVSHVAIRARNAPVLFATCYDRTIMEELETFAGDWMDMASNPAGDVTFQRGSGLKETDESTHPLPAVGTETMSLTKPVFSSFAIPSKDFNNGVVGAKSNNLNKMRGKLPSWISLPESVALPFGVFEKVLLDDMNKAVATDYGVLTDDIDKKSLGDRAKALESIKRAVMALKAPAGLRDRLGEVLNASSLPWSPDSESDWDAGWNCIKQVWASKWNERAYVSRKTVGIPHEDLCMAVLIQEVVAAEYAFVIHTVNPVTGADDEIFAEVVPGLGETLVGNFPGRAFSFSCKKGREETSLIHSFPSKSMGLYGKGVFFRSDSNGEDLSQYAGAGLYDSVTLYPPQEMLLDYAHDRLVTDTAFQRELLTDIAKIGGEIEKALGSPQDIEGAYSQGKYYVVQTRPQVGLA